MKKEAGGEGRRRRKQAEKEASLSLTTVIKTNEELITRMKNHLQQLKNELQKELRNPSLGDTDNQLEHTNTGGKNKGKGKRKNN